jgi:hypothetical protein
VKFISPFISPKLAFETKRSSSPSLQPKPCPSGHLDVVLDNGRDSTLILHDISLENKNFCAMDISKAPTLETKEHESFFFETLHVSCSRLESLEFVVLSADCYYEEDNHPSLMLKKAITFINKGNNQ